MPCSQVQLARVVVCVRVLVDVICVMIVVLIARVDVVHAVDTVLVAIFVVIFSNWRCTLYTSKETVLLLGLLFLQTDSSFEVRIMDDSVQR